MSSVYIQYILIHNIVKQPSSHYINMPHKYVGFHHMVAHTQYIQLYIGAAC